MGSAHLQWSRYADFILTQLRIHLSDKIGHCRKGLHCEIIFFSGFEISFGNISFKECLIPFRKTYPVAHIFIESLAARNISCWINIRTIVDFSVDRSSWHEQKTFLLCPRGNTFLGLCVNVSLVDQLSKFVNSLHSWKPFLQRIM